MTAKRKTSITSGSASTMTPVVPNRRGAKNAKRHMLAIVLVAAFLIGQSQLLTTGFLDTASSIWESPYQHIKPDFLFVGYLGGDDDADADAEWEDEGHSDAEGDAEGDADDGIDFTLLLQLSPNITQIRAAVTGEQGEPAENAAQRQKHLEQSQTAGATLILTQSMQPTKHSATSKLCACEVVSVDCLESIDCLSIRDDNEDDTDDASYTVLHDGEEISLSYVLTNQQRRQVMMGIATRIAIRSFGNIVSTGTNQFGPVGLVTPPGKGMQYLGITSWQHFTQRRPMQVRYGTRNSFADELFHPECHANSTSNPLGRTLVGKSCFFRDWDAEEQFEPMEQLSWPAAGITADARAVGSTNGDADANATQQQTAENEDADEREGSDLPSQLRSLSAAAAHPSLLALGCSDLINAKQFHEMMQLAYTDVRDYMSAVQGRRMWIDVKTNPNSTKNTVSPMADLLVFCHIILIRYNRRAGTQQFYDDHVKTIAAQTSRHGPNRKAFPVSMHLRRADSCGHKKRHRFEPKASPLDSVPQTSGRRMCYATRVYLDSLERIEDKVQRPLEVYLSTDYAEHLLTEIRTDEPDLYNRITWKVIEVSRDTFKYQGYVEGAEDNHRHLGESAFADMWHLSHGQAFVGHLGSRFGKVSWYLATARYNSLVPFFSVDGHSVCCEIDESCGAVASSITSMENCLTFSHEILGRQHDSYWEKGSLMRTAMANDPNRQKKYARRSGYLHY